jgi:hypothetical protein
MFFVSLAGVKRATDSPTFAGCVDWPVADKSRIDRIAKSAWSVMNLFSTPKIWIYRDSHAKPFAL